MTDRARHIGRVRLARSLPRLLAVPALLLLAGAGLAAYGAFASPMPVGWLFVAAGSLLGLSGLAWAVWLSSVRLEVEEAAIRVRWIGGGHRYALSPGSVTRVRLRGDDASRLRVRTGLLGWGIGPGRLRDEEEIHVVRLAPTPTAILVPTRDGRLAVAAAVESELLDALAQAARARQRTAEEEAAAAAPGDELVAPPPPVDLDEAPAPTAEQARPDEPPFEPEPRFMTGIERAQYERRLAMALEATAAVEAAPGEVEGPAAAPVAAAPAPPAAPSAAVETRPRRRWVPRPSVRRPSASSAMVLLPVLAAGAVWALALAGDRLAPAETEYGRLTALALVLAGPASAVGAIVARVWWPRLTGAVVVAGLAATLLIGRALLP